MPFQLYAIVIEITHRLQTARPTVRQLLFRYLLPWLCNMELVDPNLPPMSSGYNYPTYCADLGRSVPGAAPNNMAGDANDTGFCLLKFCCFRCSK